MTHEADHLGAIVERIAAELTRWIKVAVLKPLKVGVHNTLYNKYNARKKSHKPKDAL